MKVYTLIAILLLSSNLNPIISQGISESINYNGMTFEIRDNKSDELILTKYTGNDEVITVPETIEGYTITAIDSGVFKDNQSVKEISLPDTIYYFGSEVFRNSLINYVNIPKSLKVIPEYTFNNCSELETVVFHDEILLLDCTAFRKTDIELPEELYSRVKEYIKTSNVYIECANEYDDWVYTIKSKDSDVYICLKRYMKNDIDIVLPDKINGIPVTEAVGNVFEDRTSDIKSIYFPETMKKPYIYFKGSNLEEVTFSNVTYIDEYEFADCKNLKKVSINSTSELVSIDSNAFSNCDNLTDITFSGSCKEISIGSDAFKNCTGIKSIPYPETCNKIDIGDNAFENTSISEIYFDFDSTIGVNAFRDCPELANVSLKNSYVCFSAFRNCPELDTVIVNGNSTLEEYSFYDCEKLENITVEDLSIPMVNAVSECRNFMKINNQNVFDSSTGDFSNNWKDFVFSNFYGVDDVGFINLYVKAQAEKIVEEITSDNMTDMQKIKAVHDWVCNNTVYDDGLSGNRKNHNDASVLINDSTVCEGYARIANILYDTAGIETYYISGVGHAWNVVRAGNNYFHVDTTWDDGDKISYDWFMKSDEEMKNSDAYHASWKTYIPSSLHSFQQGKPLPECSYSMGDVNRDNNVNIADMVILNKYILNQNTLDSDNYILSDLTFDGIIDSFDLVKMRQLLIN